jgi:hypothetical protein
VAGWAGSRLPELAGIVISYKAALDAIQVAAAIDRVSDVSVWEELGAWRLLCLIPDEDRAYAAIHPGIGRLAWLRDRPALLRALEPYLDLGGDAAATARSPLHPPHEPVRPAAD